MRNPHSASLPALALLAAWPVLMPWSQPPVLTALAELCTWAVAGIVAMVLGWRAWNTSPLQVAGFREPDERRSEAPALLILTAAIAGLLSAFIGIVQVLLPEALQGGLGQWLLPTHLPGRAVGHLRQPNHLATVLLWGAVAWVVLQAQLELSRGAAFTGMALIIAALVFTGSRTGLLGIALLIAWAVMDKRLPGSARLLLATTPVIAAAAWWILQILSAQRGLDAGALAHLGGSSGGDISSSRFAIWRNAATLIEQNPWTGVGWGRFNTAWTLTPMGERPMALFSHAHNLPLHLVVELGIPLGLLLCGVLGAALVTATRRAWSSQGSPAEAVARRGAVVMLAIVALHSLLEYPLWYAYLGLPAALAWVVCMGWDRPWTRAARWQGVLLLGGGALVLAGAAWAYGDYRIISAIYAPGPKEDHLDQRIARGEKTHWFTKQAHYARATTFKPRPGQPWDTVTERAFERAPRVLLDPRLMMAWADALAVRDGPHDRDRARYLAARLREFRAPSAQEWLQACDDPEAPAHRHFVCEPPQAAWTWRDFGLR